MSLKAPSPREKEMLKLVYAWESRGSYAPTYQDLADLMQISVPGIQSKIKMLCEKGHMTRTPGVHRSLVLTNEGREWIVTNGD